MGAAGKQEHERLQVLSRGVITGTARVRHPEIGKGHSKRFPPPPHKFFCASGMTVGSWVPGVNNSEPKIRKTSGWKNRQKEILLVMHIIQNNPLQGSH